jgi:hypothetical protein
MTKLINPISMFFQDKPSIDPLLIITVRVEHPENNNNNNLEIPLLGKQRHCKTD